MEIKKAYWGIREKLIGIFVLIKVIPLVIVAWIAWEAVKSLGDNVTTNVEEMSASMRDAVAQAGDLAIQDVIRALDLRSREAIEQRTTDTAQAVAAFLYGRNQDTQFAAKIAPGRDAYAEFLASRTRPVVLHGPWKLKDDDSGWEPVAESSRQTPDITPQLSDNEKDFHYRPPETWGRRVEKPLYLEMAFIDIRGMEQVKVTASPLADPAHKNLSRKEETWWRSEDFFPELEALQPGEIYVSDVIGPYVSSKIIGPYTRAKAKKAGIPFAPEVSGYAGKENPVGKRFQGIVRWATPVARAGQIVGWVTLVLDHTHIMGFTDHLNPTPERYTAISDPGSGNYAFMWDYRGRSISHPRDYFIVGYDPETGEPVMPWLGTEFYADWQQSGKSYAKWQKTAPAFHGQSLKNLPNVSLTKAGTIALDCRYLSFAPQCAGWNNLTQNGGSGSFVIYWSGLWKLTTVATIPYYTGQYGSTSRGFGYVTIGANVHEFYKPARESETRISALITNRNEDMKMRQDETQSDILASLKTVATNLVESTVFMIVIVIVIAVIMANTLTRRITNMIGGIGKFQDGDLTFRLAIKTQDEMGQLSASFNRMAESIGDHQNNLEGRVQARTAELNDEIAERKKLERELQALARFDHLTELPNRREFDRQLERALSLRSRTFSQIAILFLDMDGFKGVNDELGHEAGDHVLKIIAKRLEKSLRRDSTAGRVGGDEFALILESNVTRDGTVVVAKKILAELAIPYSLPNGKSVSLSVSIGIAFAPDDGEETGQLLSSADKAMYKAKKSGKNCYVMAS